jgi:hypothetical protein
LVDGFHDRVILDPFLARRMRLAVLGDTLGEVVQLKRKLVF